ncbi:MAG: hypothetical protein ABSC23_17370 [Bryobacteraceae bacterium]|jgi:type IV pilus assembly protein PilN
MRIPINLASQPFRRVRAMLVASVAASLLLTALLAGQILLILANRAQMADVRQHVDRLNRQIRQATAEQATLSAALRRPENAEVFERGVFVNALLNRKGISWTGIFSDLEKVLPYNVKVIRIRPTLNARDQVQLDMTVACEAPDSEIQFLMALENSPLFGEVQEPTRTPPSQAEPLNQYRVMVRYAQKP